MQVSTATQVICDRDTWKGQRVLNERKNRWEVRRTGEESQNREGGKYNPKPHGAAE